MQPNSTMNPPNKVQCFCGTCMKAFYKSPSQVAIGRGKYCSKTCCDNATSKKISCICETCGKEFFVKPSRLATGRGCKYCSQLCYHSVPNERIPLEVRFWAKVDKGKPRDCWLWTGSVNENGYGKIGLGGRGEGIVYAHRVSWILHNGPIPEGKDILHNCWPKQDNPRCVNPAHLWLGTAADNSQDMVNKGRSSRGEKNGMAVLTEAAVREIKLADTSDLGCTIKLAEKYGVHPGTIADILNGKRWRHVV